MLSRMNNNLRQAGCAKGLRNRRGLYELWPRTDHGQDFHAEDLAVSKPVFRRTCSITRAVCKARASHECS